MAAPWQVVEQVFNQASSMASSFSGQASNRLSSAVNSIGNAPSISSAPFSYIPFVVEPSVNIPQQAEGASVARFTELSQQVIQYLAGLFSAYYEQYFPQDVPYIRDAEEWIDNVIKNGGTGIPAHVEDQIWERDRRRILQDSQRVEEEAVTSWAAKRFPLPPGALAYTVLNIRKDSADKIAQLSRDVAIKQADIEIQNIRFAIEQAVKLYTAATQAATDYIKALSIGPQSAMQVIPSITDSQSRLISAASEYYRARIAVEELRLKGLSTQAELTQSTSVKNAELKMDELKARVNAAVEGARSAATIAAAALNALHASVSTAGTENVQFVYHGETADERSPG